MVAVRNSAETFSERTRTGGNFKNNNHLKSGRCPKVMQSDILGHLRYHLLTLSNPQLRVTGVLWAGVRCGGPPLGAGPQHFLALLKVWISEAKNLGKCGL